MSNTKTNSPEEYQGRAFHGPGELCAQGNQIVLDGKRIPFLFGVEHTLGLLQRQAGLDMPNVTQKNILDLGSRGISNTVGVQTAVLAG